MNYQCGVDICNEIVYLCPAESYCTMVLSVESSLQYISVGSIMRHEVIFRYKQNLYSVLNVWFGLYICASCMLQWPNEMHIAQLA